MTNYHAPPKPRCYCGNVAIVRRAGSFVCERCLAIEKRFERSEKAKGVQRTRAVKAPPPSPPPQQ